MLLSAMVADASLLHDARPCLSTESFQDKNEKLLAQAVLAHFDRYGTVPSEGTVREVLHTNGFDIEECDGLLTKLANHPSDPRWVKDKVVEHYQARRINEAMEEAAEMIGRGESVTNVRSLLLQALTDGDRTDQPGEFWEDTIEERLKRYRELHEDPLSFGRVPTGFSCVDSNVSGGLGPGELGVLVARPNGGKTAFLVNIGANATRARFKVVHFSYEMGRKAVLRRYDMCYTRMGKSQLATQQKTAYERLQEHARTQNYKRLLVKEYPTGSAGPAVLDSYLRLSSARDGFAPDVVLVDYAALMLAETNYDQMRHQLAAIYRNIRAVAVERQVPIWTAHQATRGGLESEFLGMADLAECHEINAIADVIVGINQTPKELRDGVARLQFIKNREDRANVGGMVKVDFETCVAEDLTA
jgi:replicative DNA helicase